MLTNLAKITQWIKGWGGDINMEFSSFLAIQSYTWQPREEVFPTGQQQTERTPPHHPDTLLFLSWTDHITVAATLIVVTDNSSAIAGCSSGNKNLGSEDLDLPPCVISHKSLHLSELQVPNWQNQAHNTRWSETGVRTKWADACGLLHGATDVLKTGSSWWGSVFFISVFLVFTVVPGTHEPSINGDQVKEWSQLLHLNAGCLCDDNNTMYLLFISQCCLFFVDTGTPTTILCFMPLEICLKKSLDKNVFSNKPNR